MRILIIGPSWVGDMVMAQTLFPEPQATAPRLPDRRAGTRMEPPDPGAHAPSARGLELSARPRRARTGHAPTHRQKPEGSVRPGHPAAQLAEIGAGAVLRRHPQTHRLARRVSLWPAQRRAHAGQATLPVDDRTLHGLAFEPGALLPQPYPRPELRIDPASRDAALAKFGLALDRPVLALCPGAEFGEAKRWPSEHYAEVAEIKIREGWQVWLFGSKKDFPVGEAIRERLIPGLREEAYNLSGETALAEAST